MPVDLSIQGADKYAAAARALKSAPKELRAELNKAISRSVVPLRRAMKANAPKVLPRRGGLGARVGRSSIATRKRTGARNPSVRLEVKPTAVKDPERIDRGRVRHPTYGRRPWVVQNVPKGWASKPVEKHATQIRKDVIGAIDTVTAKLSR